MRSLRLSDKRLSTLLEVNQIAVSSNEERVRSDIEWKKVLEQVGREIEASRHKRNKGFDDFENADKPWDCSYCRYSDVLQSKIKSEI